MYRIDALMHDVENNIFDIIFQAKANHENIES